MWRRGAFAVLVAAAWSTSAPSALGVVYRVSDPVIVSGPAGLGERCLPSPVEAETFLASDPVRPRHLVATWNAADENLDTTAITAVSRNNGATWRRSFVGGTSRCTGSARDFSFDGWSAVGPDAAAYYAGLAGAAGSLPDQAILGAASADGGAVWADAQVVDENDSGVKGILSRTSVTADPHHAGRAWILFSRFVVTPFDGTYVVRTDDGGRSWSSPVLVAQHPGGAVPAWETVVLPDGTLLAFFADVDTQGTLQELALHASGPAEAVVARSTDGGRTWGAAVPIVHLPAYVLARAAVAPDGTVHFVFNEQRGDKQAVRVVRSDDGGTTWSAPSDVDSFPANGLESLDIQPNIAVGRDNAVGVSWFDARNRPDGEQRKLVDRYFAASDDNGATWTRTHLAGPSEMSGKGNGDGPFGAYQGLAATARGFGALYVQGPGQARDGHTDVFYSAISRTDAPRRLQVAVVPRRARAGRRRTFRFAVTTRAGGAVAGARVRFAGRRVRTGADGGAVVTRAFSRAGTRWARVRKPGYKPARLRVRIRASMP